ncbi:cytochrome c oxidase assembly protein subunit 15 [Collimonas sp. OK607]|uniref:COX15/CtaA family protein n=1 Tax=Collimonas sp. OK607 TaxID=1798194 RepID=UPI0008E10FEC|nr:COX15/CtaA family protein [Collimonas sp. OK607]SFB32239.1 cytochrome c oxidase assembly protein subunit 15 [Collimonas sp. OK607]
MTTPMLFQLGSMGLLVALLAFCVVWVSSDTNKYRKLVWVTLFLTFDLIMFGAFTRLTDSGLGCPDWPGCYGHSNPLQAHAHISAAQEAMPDGPVTVMKAWIEMTHRYFAMGVGVLIISLMVIAWMRWLGWPKAGNSASGQKSRQESKFSPWFPTVLFLFVCLQGAFGAWTVTQKLQPVIVTTHLLLGLTLLAMLTWLGARQSAHAPVAASAASLVKPALIGMLLLVLQIALGGWVSTNYAALACTDFPTCHGALVPHMDFANGFTLWRHLGMTADGEFLSFQALTAIHWTHRSFAFVVIAFIVWLACKALRTQGLEKTGRWLLIIVGLQLITGLSTIFLNWPLSIAVAHNGGAALLLLLLVMLNYKARLALSVSSVLGAPSHPTADRLNPQP